MITGNNYAHLYFYSQINSNLEQASENYNQQQASKSPNAVGWTYHQNIHSRSNGLHNERISGGGNPRENIINSYDNENATPFDRAYNGNAIATSPTSPNVQNNQVNLSLSLIN